MADFTPTIYAATRAVSTAPNFTDNEAAAPATEVAVNRTLWRLPEVALRTSSPAPGPRVHDPTVATPEASVVTVPPETDPPPAATSKVTVSPAIGDPFWSFTMTDGAGVTIAPTAPVTEVEEFGTSVVATGGPDVSLPPQLMTARRSQGDQRLSTTAASRTEDACRLLFSGAHPVHAMPAL